MIMNQISSENCTEKIKELRKFLFPNFKTRNEVWADGIDYNEAIHKLTDQNLKFGTIDEIVQNIFAKVLEGKFSCSFARQICEEFFYLELSLRDIFSINLNLQQTQFRKSLIQKCNNRFQKFFEQDNKQKLLKSQ